ncbi:MAG: hypothetical protein F4X45_08460 [Chloroflexi bacterium]|nr:hypothetical protein [Chloroflexota bacterium]
MARIQLVLPDADKDQFVKQARSEGMSLSQWLRTAAHERLERTHGSDSWSLRELESFFQECDELDGPENEPDWGGHLRALDVTDPTLT